MKVWVWLLALGFVATSSATLAAGTGSTVQVSMDKATYTALGILAEGAPVASALVQDAQGAPLAGVEVRFVVVRQVPGVGFAGNETLFATTDEGGLASVSVGTASTLVGDYVVLAHAAGASSNAARYKVAAA